MLTGSTSLSFLSPPAVFGTFFDPFSPLSWSLEQAIVKDGHSPFFTALHIFDCGYIHIFPAIACFLHFVATEDSLKARNS